MNAKRKKIEEMIYGVFDRLDKTGTNTKKYKAIFSRMDDKAFNSYMKKFFADDSRNYYLEILPFEREPKLEHIKEAADYLKVPLEEYVYLPFSNPDGEPLRTRYKVPVGYIHIKRLQQILSKKNSFSVNIENRNVKTGQVISDDKNARVSDIENFALVAIGADEALKEFMGPRADDMIMKQQMIKDIHRDGYVALNSLKSDIKDKQALNTLDVYFMGAGILTDLVTPGLMFRKTLDDRKEQETIKEKYER